MKTTIETLTFPCEIKNKLKIKTSLANLKVEFINGHIIKFDKTNLSVQEPHKIIIKGKNNTLIALIYNDTDKIYLSNNNAILSFNKFVSLINLLNKL